MRLCRPYNAPPPTNIQVHVQALTGVTYCRQRLELMRHVYNEELAESEMAVSGPSGPGDLLRCLTQCPQTQRFSLATLLPSRLVPRASCFRLTLNPTRIACFYTLNGSSRQCSDLARSIMWSVECCRVMRK